MRLPARFGGKESDRDPGVLREELEGGKREPHAPRGLLDRCHESGAERATGVSQAGASGYDPPGAP